jgi:type III pantothenate kinase
MILGFDIGNSNTVAGIYEGREVLPSFTYRYRTIREATVDELGLSVRSLIDHCTARPGQGGSVDGAVLASVVPELNDRYVQMCRKYLDLPLVIISSASRMSISIRYDDPARLGVDRIVNAEAVFREYKGDCIIVDLGTAATFCVLHGDGTYDGGIIAPGIGITIEALASRTSQLMKVQFEKPERLIARNTVDAIKSGFYYGWISMIEGIIARTSAQFGKKFTPVITGGYAEALREDLPSPYIIDPNLTMKGLRYLYEMNK